MWPQLEPHAAERVGRAPLGAPENGYRKRAGQARMACPATISCRFLGLEARYFVPGGGLEPPTRGFSPLPGGCTLYIVSLSSIHYYILCLLAVWRVRFFRDFRPFGYHLAIKSSPAVGRNGPGGARPQGLDARFGPRRGPGKKSGPRRAESPHKLPLNGRPACRRRGLRTPRDGSRIPRTPTLPEKFSGPPGEQKCCPVVGRRGAAGVVNINSRRSPGDFRRPEVDGSRW